MWSGGLFMWPFGRKKKIVNQHQITHALMQVPHPELNSDVVSLGLVKNLALSTDLVSFDLEIAKPAAYVEELKRHCEQAVVNLGVPRVKVQVTYRPLKSPDRGRRSIPGVRRVLAIAGGKGGVGKSTVAFELARALSRRGMRVGLADCDIYGPSLPSLSGISSPPDMPGERQIIPHEAHGLQLISAGYMIKSDQALVWRGPMVHKLVLQLLFDVAWGELDVLLLDLPPGTGDVQLSITQSLRLAGGLIVTTPQQVALADAVKASAMFESVKVPTLGVIENMSFYRCGSCEKEHRLFPAASKGTSQVLPQLPLLARLAMDPGLASKSGPGPETISRFDELADRVSDLLARLPEPARVPGHIAPVGSSGWATPGPGSFEV